MAEFVKTMRQIRRICNGSKEGATCPLNNTDACLVNPAEGGVPEGSMMTEEG